jgi:hypothetical protein
LSKNKFYIGQLVVAVFGGLPYTCKVVGTRNDFGNYTYQLSNSDGRTTWTGENLIKSLSDLKNEEVYLPIEKAVSLNQYEAAAVAWVIYSCVCMTDDSIYDYLASAKEKILEEFKFDFPTLEFDEFLEQPLCLVPAKQTGEKFRNAVKELMNDSF